MTFPSGPTTATAMRQLFFLASAKAAVATALARSALMGMPYSGGGPLVVAAGSACAGTPSHRAITAAITTRTDISRLHPSERACRRTGRHDVVEKWSSLTTADQPATRERLRIGDLPQD